MELEPGAEAPPEVVPEEGAESQEGLPNEGAPQEGEPEEYTPLSTDELAGEMGWTPKETWRGDPEKWKPSDQFLKSTVNVNKNLSGSLKSLERQVQTMAATSAKLTESAVNKARDEAMAKRKEAFEVGDAEAFEKADQELKSVSEMPAAQVIDPEGEKFAEKHANWFGKDDEATNYAYSRADHYAKQGLSASRQLMLAEQDVKKAFPEHFPAARAKSVPLNKPGGRGAVPAAKGYTTLPSDAKSAAEDYEARGICSKEDYAKTYYEELAG